MSSHPKNTKLLEKINNIGKDYSEDDKEISDIESDTKGNNYNLFYNDSDTDSNEENILNIRRGQKSMKFIVSSKSENEEELTETARRNCLAKNKRRV